MFKLGILGAALVFMLVPLATVDAQNTPEHKALGGTATGFAAVPVEDSELAATTSPSPTGGNVSPDGVIGGSASAATGANRVDTPGLAASSVRAGPSVSAPQQVTIPPSVVDALGARGIAVPTNR